RSSWPQATNSPGGSGAGRRTLERGLRPGHALTPSAGRVGVDLDVLGLGIPKRLDGLVGTLRESAYAGRGPVCSGTSTFVMGTHRAGTLDASPPPAPLATPSSGCRAGSA